MESNLLITKDHKKDERVSGQDLKLVEELLKSLAQIEYECYKS